VNDPTQLFSAAVSAQSAGQLDRAIGLYRKFIDVASPDKSIQAQELAAAHELAYRSMWKNWCDSPKN